MEKRDRSVTGWPARAYEAGLRRLVVDALRPSPTYDPKKTFVFSGFCLLGRAMGRRPAVFVDALVVLATHGRIWSATAAGTPMYELYTL